MAGTGTGKGKEDELISLMREVLRGQQVQNKMTARAEARAVIREARLTTNIEKLNDEVFGTRSYPGLKKMVMLLTTRMNMAIGAMLVISAAVAWIANHLNLNAILLGGK